MHRIKKYANRKMYDLTDKRYVSMDRLADIIKSDEEVSIVDNRTGKDLTAAIVSQLLAREKRSKVISPRLLMQLLRKGGDTFSDYAKKYAALWQGALTMAEDEVDQLVNRLVSKRELTRAEGRRLKEELVGHTETMKRWVGERIDRRLNEMLGAMNLATKEQVEDLAARLEHLGREVEKLRRAARKTRPGSRR